MTFAQLLASKRWAKVGVSVANQNQCPARRYLIKLSIAWTTSRCRAHTGRASLLVPKHQTLDLAHRQMQTLGSQARFEHPVHDGLNHFESVEFAHVQRHQFGRLHGELPSLDRKLPASHQKQNTTFLSCSNTTLGYCPYKQIVDNLCYVKSIKPARRNY